MNSFSEIEESVLFERVAIGRHAKIRRASSTRTSRSPRAEIGYNLEADRKRFFVSERGSS